MAKTKKAAAASNPKKSTAAPNLFETLWSRRKFDILGKKQKGEGKRIGQLRSRAIEKRKKTILQEYKVRHKSNAFTDRRFGENDENMGEDEKAIMRFQRERQAQLQKKNKFALPDVEDDEEEDILTHKGAALAELDDFKDDVSVEDDDDESRELDEETEKALNFGGGNTESEDKKEHRSKKEIMEEVIAKSKHFKALKAKQKEDDQELREKLDKDFKLLAETPALLSLVRPTKTNPLKALLAKKSEGADIDAVNETVEKDQPDEYDKLMKEMVFDIRAHASDRLKTAEEIAKEEKERLEELEKKRKQRMIGTTESESENEESDMENDEKKRKRKRLTEISGDDLGENFVLEEEYQEKGWVDEVMARTNDEGDDADSEMDDDEDEDDEGDQEESDEDEEIDEEVAVPGHENLTSPPSKGNDVVSAKGDEDKGVTEEYASELPYVIKAPENLDDFRGLVKNRSDAELEIAIQRVRTCNAISLAAENRKKMQIFYNVLVLYFSELAGSKQLNLARINVLTRPLIEMSSETPYFAATCARERLVRMQKQLSEKLRIKDGSSCWPSVRTLLLMRLWSLIFPASDFRHVVVTPLMLLMGEYLIRCPITSTHDVAVGSFLCSLSLSIMKHARRFCPEALNFLLGLLSTGLPQTSLSRKQCPQYLRELIGNQPWLLLKDSCPDVKPLGFIEIMTTEAESDILNSDAFRAGVLRASLQTLMGFVEIYKDLPSFPEVFKQFLPVLLELSLSKNIPLQLKASLKEPINVIKSTVEEQENFRQPLRMRLKKPTPIKQYNPKFEEDYAKGRDYDIDKERAERKKLLKQIKRESKGAVRELKKDNQFLAAEKQKERMEVEQEREEKYRTAMAFLEEQEAAAKSGQLGRKRRRR